MRSSSRCPVPWRTRPRCAWPRGRTRDSGSERVSVDAWGFDVERQATARRLRSLRIQLSAIRSAIAAALTLALVFGGGGAFRGFVVSLSGPPLGAPGALLALFFGPAAAGGLSVCYIAGYPWGS